MSQYNPELKRVAADEMNIRAYNQWRARRREAELTRAGERPDTEMADLIEFASKWSPFGGAPDEEIFLRFGISSTEFTQRLRDAR